MKYKDIFKAWWFYSLVIGFFLYRILFRTGFRFYSGIEFIPLYLGAFIGSFIGILFLVSIFWALTKIFIAILPKKKKS